MFRMLTFYRIILARCRSSLGMSGMSLGRDKPRNIVRQYIRESSWALLRRRGPSLCDNLGNSAVL
jgi:hypothetical protein